MSWSGDIGRIGKLADRVAELASVPSRVAARVAEEFEAELQAGFDAGADPYGEPWAPLADATLASGRTPPPLTASGDMRGTLRVAPMAGAGVSVTIAPLPALPHQTGWGGPQGWGPARPILPDRSELPDRWQDRLADACADEFERTMGGRR